MTDFRALCAELVKDLDDLRESSEGVAGFHRNGDLAPWDELSESGRYPWLSSFDRARAALFPPEPVAPTDEELDEFVVFWWGSDTDERTVTDVIECCSMTAFARAVLARWGTPQPNHRSTQ
jgi:hypothetical protein